MDLKEGWPVAIREAVGEPWQMATYLGFGEAHLFAVKHKTAVEIYALDLTPDSPDWQLIGPPF